MKRTRSTQTAVAAVFLTCALCAWSATATAASLTIYNSRVAFATANPGLAVEDFEDVSFAGPISPAFSDPLDSLTNNGIVAPGDILQGVTFSTPDNIVPDADLVFVGPGYVPSWTERPDVTTTMLGSNVGTDNLDMFFSSGISAVGFDFFNVWGPASPMTISLYENNSLIGSFDVQMQESGYYFFGATAFDGQVSRINVLHTGSHDDFEFIDNVTFGTSGNVSPVPVPATILLLGSGIAGLGAIRRKRNSTH